MTNVHRFNHDFSPKKLLLISDIHWDSPYCQRDILKRHLDEAVEQDCHIHLNGDTWTLWQGGESLEVAKEV